MPGKGKYKSIKKPKLYRKLKSEGHDKSSAAPSATPWRTARSIDVGASVRSE